MPILKLLKSGVAAASNNFSISADNLFVSGIFVGEGRMLKRFMPRAFGRAGAIHKKTSHITLILEEKIPGLKTAVNKIKTVRPETAGKTEPAKESVAEKPFRTERAEKEAVKEIAPKKSLKGATRKVFRRKVV